MSDESKQRSWEDHWAEGYIPWDAGAASPSLTACLRRLDLPKRSRALVPGCGSGYDVFELAKHGCEAIGLDIAPSARPRFEELRKLAGLSEHEARLVTGDFFSVAPDQLGAPLDFVWDYTFYCAISPEQRDAWRDRMTQLLDPNGTLAMLLFPVVPRSDETQGPPFPLDPQRVKHQLAPRFSCISLEPASESHPQREGKEWLSLWRPLPNTS